MRRILLLASAIVFVDTVFYAAVTPLLPQFADEFGLSKTGAGILVASYAAGTFVGALPGGWLAGRAGTRATVLVGLTLTGVTSIAFAFAQNVIVLDLARFLQGVGGAFSWAGALGWLIGAAPRARRGEMIGSTMAAAIVGALVGPAFGALAAATSPEAVFSSVALATAALAVFALRTPGGGARARRRGCATSSRRCAGRRWWAACGSPRCRGCCSARSACSRRCGSTSSAPAARRSPAVFLFAAALEARDEPDRRPAVGPARAPRCR